MKHQIQILDRLIFFQEQYHSIKISSRQSYPWNAFFKPQRYLQKANLSYWSSCLLNANWENNIGLAQMEFSHQSIMSQCSYIDTFLFMTFTKVTMCAILYFLSWEKSSPYTYLSSLKKIIRVFVPNFWTVFLYLTTMLKSANH